MDDVVLGFPDRGIGDGRVDVVVHLVELLFEVGDGLADGPLHALGGRVSAKTVFFGSDHVDHLPARGEKRSKLLGLCVDRWADGWPYSFGEKSDNGGVQGIGLRETAISLGEVANSSGVDDDSGQVGSEERRKQASFESTGGL